MQGGRDAVESGFWGRIGLSDGNLFCPIWPPGIFTGVEALEGEDVHTTYLGRHRGRENWEPHSKHEGAASVLTLRRTFMQSVQVRDDR